MSEINAATPEIRSVDDGPLSQVGLSIAVLLPCYNEELTIAQTVSDFAAHLPTAKIYVCDNNSSDNTAKVAAEAGAHVLVERLQGKGNAVRRMFQEIDADIYVMADGDGTYSAADVPDMIRSLIDDRLEMVVGRRRGIEDDAGRAGHAFGNRLFNWVFGHMFGASFTDIFSGLRVFNRRFAKSFPAISRGFEIETEMSVHANQLRLPVAEVEVAYGKRPKGSQSKLNTFRDGTRILMVFLLLMKETRPMFFFTIVSTLFALASLGLGQGVIVDYFQTGLVERLPTAVLAASMMIIAFVMFVAGLILDSVCRSRIELKRMFMLSQRGLPFR